MIYKYTKTVTAFFWAAMILLGWHGFNLLVQAYYQYAPISFFYKNHSLIARDVCVGEEGQVIESNRYVVTTEGLNGTVTRELFLVTMDGNEVKILNEKADVHIEKKDHVLRVQPLPKLKVGEYRWKLRIIIHLNYGVDRYDVPIIDSNVFKVKEC